MKTAFMLFLFSFVPAYAQDEVPVFAVPAVVTAPIPVEMADPTGFHANAVDINGTLRLRFADISVAARGWPLTLGHSYVAGAADTGLGPGWAWSFGLRISQSRDTGTYFIRESDGSQSAYAQINGQEFEAVSGRLDSRLLRLPDGGLRRLYADGSQEIFTANLRLAARRGADGTGYDISYDDSGQPNLVRHEDGQAFVFKWQAGRLAQGTDAMGREMQFTYADGRLSATRDALGRETQYSYDASGRLMAVQFVDGEGLAIEYDVNGRVARLQGPGTLDTRFDHWGTIEQGRLVQVRTDVEGRRYRLEISRDPKRADQLSVVSIDPGGVRTVRDYRDGQIDISRNGHWIGGMLLDATGTPAVLIQNSGAVPLAPAGVGNTVNTSLAHPDAMGFARLVIGADGQPAWRQYDAVGRITALAGATGRVERFTYDTGNRLLTHLDLSDTLVSYEYDAADRPLEWQAEDGRWRRFSYSALGLVSGISGNDIEDIIYSYDRSGQLQQMREGAYVWSVKYNSSGIFTGLKDATGRGATYRYDQSGQLLGVDDDYGPSVAIHSEGSLTLTDDLGRLRGIATDEEGRTYHLGEGGTRTYFETLEGGDQLITHLLPGGSGWVERRSETGELIAMETLGHNPFVIETGENGVPGVMGDPVMPSTLKFDERGLLSETTDRIGVVSSFTHDDNGRLNSASSPYGGVELEYGDGDIPLLARTSEGVILRQEVDKLGRPTLYSYEDETGTSLTQSMEYDQRDRLARVEIDGVVTEYAYVNGDTTEMVISGEGWVENWRESYDPETAQRTIMRPDGSQSVTTFDKAGRAVRVQTPVRQISYELDAEGQVLAITTDGHREELGPDAIGWKVVETEYLQIDNTDVEAVVRIDTMADPTGSQWRVGYAHDDIALWSEDPLGGITQVVRIGDGQISSVTDPEGRVHYAIYDDLGRAVETGVVGGWSRSLGWDGTKPAGRSYSGGTQSWLEMEAHSNQARSIVNGQTQTSFEFDDSGFLTAATNGTGEIAIGYDSRDQIVAITDVFGRKITQEFDAFGRLVAVVLPEGDRIEYAYADGNSITQTGPDGAKTQTTYTPETAQYDIALPDGVLATLTLGRSDDFGALLVKGGDGESSGQITLETAPDRSVMAVVVNDERHKVELDALGRMTGFSQSDGSRQSWDYDGSGNIIAANGQNRSYNAAFQLIENAAETLGYDLDGRLISKGDTEFQYSALGRLIRVSGPGVDLQLAYDAFGQVVERRMGDKVEQYLWHDGKLLAIYDGAGNRLALLERNLALPLALRLHDSSGSRLLLPDHLGTPLFEVAAGRVETLPTYGPWGRKPDAGADYHRWLGYGGNLQDAAAGGLVHMGARVYLPEIARFNAPDPLGIENPVNPYFYASLQPLTFVDATGANTQRLGFGPYTFGTENLNPNRGLPTGSVRNSPQNRRMFGSVLADLENIVNNDPRPEVRGAASRTLHTLRTQGVQVQMGSNVQGYGYYSNGTIAVNPGASTGLDPRFAGAPNGAHSTRAVSQVLGHEGTHLVQEAFERRSGQRMGRMWKELEATMTGDLLGRGVGGHSGHIPDRRAFGQALDYAVRTEYRQYLPQGHASRLSNNFHGTPHQPWRGLTQLDQSAVVQLARKYYPNMPAHEALDEFVDAHRRIANNPNAERALRQLGPEAVASRNRMVREAQRAAAQYRTAANAANAANAPRPPNTPGARATAARPTIEYPNGSRPATTRPPRPARPTITYPDGTRPARPTIEPPRASTPNRPTIEPPRAPSNRPTIEPPRTPPRAAAPPQPRAGTTRRLPAAELPSARSTQRLPTADLPNGGRATPASTRPSGANPARPARPTTARPPTQRLPRVPHTVDTPNTRPRPPSTNPPAARNPRPGVRPGTRPPRPTGATDRPRVRLTPPPGSRPSTPDAPRPARPGSMPDRPVVPDTPRPPPHGPRPSSRGGRYPIPDLDGGSGGGRGGRVTPPPRGLPDGPHGRPPGRPGGGMSGMPDGGGSNLGRNFGRGLAVLDVLVTIYQTDQYIRGNISHEDYWSGIALSGLGYVLPYPLNAALAAHQVGSFLGNYLAGKLLEEYRNGDPVARALINWMRRNGWINANDPTFVAIPEDWPPDMRARALLVLAGQPQWVPLTVWSYEADKADLKLVGADGGLINALGELPLSVGVTQTFLPADTFSSLPTGLYSVVSTSEQQGEQPVLSLRIIDPAEVETEKVTAEFDLVVDVVETRLEPTDLPWERYDRPEALIATSLPDGAKPFGAWDWLDDETAPGGTAHRASPDATPIHYALFGDGTGVVQGDNLVQYLWLDPADSPAQIVIQIYDQNLSAAHRVSLGADVIAIDEREGYGFVQSGPLPEAGRWLRLRVPLGELGMDGRQISGIGFISDGGQVRFGPTRLSGPEDTSPRIVAAAGRDVSGAPQSDITLGLTLPKPGQLSLAVVFADGSIQQLYDGAVVAGQRHFWWQGDASRLQGAKITAQLTGADGQAEEIEQRVMGNAALVARILYPPQGAVVRQTVPIFGQAGGAGFTEYEVSFRPYGAGDDSWVRLVRSSTPQVMTDAQVAGRIERILSKELRSTVYGNLASLKTGSALHRFEFAEADNVMRSGWVEIRLRSYDKDGAFAEAWTAVQIGEVATGQAPTKLASPDGKATLSIPPLSLPAGLGTFSIDLVDQSLPPGAPEPMSGVYGLTPSGLQMRAPVSVAIASETAQSIVMVERSGLATVLPSQRQAGLVVAQARQTPNGARFYAVSNASPVTTAEQAPMAAPWFTDAPDPGLLYAGFVADGQFAVSMAPVPLDQASVAMILSLTVSDPDQLALLLRFDGDARLVPIGRKLSAVRGELLGQALGLVASDDPQPVFLPLASVLPPDAKILEGIELVRIVSAAWRTAVPGDPKPGQVVLHSVAIGTMPDGGVQGWEVPYESEGQPKGSFRPENQGWHWLADADDSGLWPVLIDRSAPEIADLSPADGTETAALIVSLSAIDAAVGVDPNSLRLVLNDVTIPAAQISYSGASGQIEAQIGNIPGLKISSGSEITASVQIADHFGQYSALQSWRWRYVAKALAFGNLRQLTLEGGESPVWLPDGSGFLFQAKRDGQMDIGRYDLESGAVDWIIAGPQNDIRPAVAEDGRIAYLSGGVLTVLADGTASEIGEGFIDPVWANGRLIAASGNTVVGFSDSGQAGVLCTAAAGATLRRPQPKGDEILFTQEIYHRTIWACDPLDGSISSLSRHPDSPVTRDVDITSAASDATGYFYFRKDGAGGLWRAERGSSRQSMVLAGDGSFDRRASLSPDAGLLLFDSDRTGRREVWVMEFDRETVFHLDSGVVTGATGGILTGTLSENAEIASWSLVGLEGTKPDTQLEISREGDNLELTLESALLEGSWQLQLETDSGLVLRQPLTVDRSPPVIIIRRLSDGADLADLAEIGPQDRFEVRITDVTRTGVRAHSGDREIFLGESFSANELVDGQLQLTAQDAVGNRTQIFASLAPVLDQGARRVTTQSSGQKGTRTDAPEKPEDPKDDDGDNGVTPIVLWLLALLIIGLAAGGWAVRRGKA